MNVDMIRNKKLNQIVSELFTRGRKLNIGIVFITKSHITAPKYLHIISTHFLL